MADIGESLVDAIGGEYKPVEASQSEQKSFYKDIKKRNKYLLIQGLSDEEKQRIADYVIKCYNDAQPKHKTLAQKMDEWDEVCRLMRKEVIGSQGDLPNYRLPLSLVAHEVIHSNVMNVFFSPKDIMRVIPTAADDIPKVNNLSTFGNWSLKNELDIFNACDRLFHASAKDGESVGMLYWKKEYAVEIRREVLRDENGETVYDEVTQEPIYREVEEPKLIYNAPYLEIISRKDYIQPEDALMNQEPEWEQVIRRITYDTYLKEEYQGKFYDGSCEYIKDWPVKSLPLQDKQDFNGENEMVGGWSKEFIEHYGRMRINVIKEGLTENDAVEAYELEDEFIAVVHKQTRTLCAIRKNRFPMKMRPFIRDYFIPDDTGRRCGIGVYELMDTLQKAYDNLYNQFIYSVELSNNPIVFFTPTGNMRDEAFKIQKGFAYPTSDANSVKLFQFPGPNNSLQYALQLVQQWSQLLFGISSYAAGMESTIDPSAPAKKAEIVVEQGNVRLNMIIKRKNDVLKQIFKRWYLLYRDNMPPNKFSRIAGEGEGDDPFKFMAISFEDFALQSIPDFELTGNILNANKQLEANKAIATYQMLATNVFFNPQTQQGLQALRSLTKWLIDKLDDAGLSRFLPKVQNEGIFFTPEEENARMLQGDDIIPLQNEDHVQHIKAHVAFLNDPNTPEQIKPIIGKHIQATIEMLRQGMTQQMVMQGMGGQQPIMPPQVNGMANNGGPGMPINNIAGANQVGGNNPTSVING